MDKKTEKHILNLLRQGTITWHVRNAAMKEGRVRRKVGKYENGKDKYLYFYPCAHCKQEFRREMMEIDHVEEVGSFDGNFDNYARRMYCDISNLQRLCIDCHQVKSSEYMYKGRRGEWKRKEK